MALVNCPDCGKEISSKAQKCPNCGHPMQKPKKKHGCLTAILSIVIFFGFIVIGIWLTKGGNNAIQREISGVSDDSEYITMAEYNKIKTGMSYQEVKEIVGSPGEVTSQVEMNGIKIVMITWYGDGMAGANANVTFENDAVTAKAQIGLK